MPTVTVETKLVVPSYSKGRNHASGDSQSDRLRELIHACGEGANKHDLVIVLIQALISEGFNTRWQIVTELKLLGFNHSHVAMTLAERAGNDPLRHDWRVDSEGRYSLLVQ